MTGGFHARSVEAKSASNEFFVTMSIVTDGRFDFGKVPPPVLAVPRPLAICSLEHLLAS